MTTLEEIENTHVTVRNPWTGGVYFIPADQISDFRTFVEEHEVTPPYAIYAGYRVTG